MENNQAHDSRLDKGNLEDQRAVENNDWEKEFDNKFYPLRSEEEMRELITDPYQTGYFWGEKDTLEKCREFIRETRPSAFQEGLEEALKVVPADITRTPLTAIEATCSECGFSTDHRVCLCPTNTGLAAARKAITSRIEESKKGKV